MENFLWIMCVIVFCAQASYQQCSIKEEKVFNLHGEYIRPAKIMPVTICNSTAVVKDHPISLETYEEFFKLIGSEYEEEANAIPVLYSDTFSRLPNIKTLISSAIQLEVIEPNAFNNLRNLKYLDLRQNRIRSLPTHIFDDTSNLKILHLEYNNLEIIDEHLFDRLINLKDLYLSMNRLKELQGHWHTGLTQLTYLNLAGNQFDILKSEMFHGLINLDRLRLPGNRLGVIERDAFKGLLKLDSLTLEFNKNISIALKQELENMPQLTGIALSPFNFDCNVYHPAMEYLTEKEVEVVEIPITSKCWKKQ